MRAQRAGGVFPAGTAGAGDECAGGFSYAGAGQSTGREATVVVFILVLLIALVIGLLYFVWDRRRWRYGRMREYQGGASAEL